MIRARRVAPALGRAHRLILAQQAHGNILPQGSCHDLASDTSDPSSPGPGRPIPPPAELGPLSLSLAPSPCFLHSSGTRSTNVRHVLPASAQDPCRGSEGNSSVWQGTWRQSGGVPAERERNPRERGIQGSHFPLGPLRLSHTASSSHSSPLTGQQHRSISFLGGIWGSSKSQQPPPENESSDPPPSQPAPSPPAPQHSTDAPAETHTTQIETQTQTQTRTLTEAPEAIDAGTTMETPGSEGISAVGEGISSLSEGVSELAAAGEGVWPPTAALQYMIDSVHVVTGWPWWISIVAATVAVRLCLLPLMLFQIKSASRQMEIAPVLKKLADRVKAYNYAAEEVERYQKETKALMKKHKVNPVAPILGGGITASTFIFFFFAIDGMARRMSSMSTGGTLWFTDLSSPDPTHILPVIGGVAILAAVELGSMDGMDTGQQENMKNMKLFMRGMACVSVPLTASFPAALLCYMITNTVLSVAQGSLLKVKSVRQTLGLPPRKPPSEQGASSSSSSMLIGSTAPGLGDSSWATNLDAAGRGDMGDQARKVPGSIPSALPPRRAVTLPNTRQGSGRKRHLSTSAWLSVVELEIHLSNSECMRNRTVG